MNESMGCVCLCLCMSEREHVFLGRGAANLGGRSRQFMGPRASQGSTEDDDMVEVGAQNYFLSGGPQFLAASLSPS